MLALSNRIAAPRLPWRLGRRGLCVRALHAPGSQWPQIAHVYVPFGIGIGIGIVLGIVLVLLVSLCIDIRKDIKVHRAPR